MRDAAAERAQIDRAIAGKTFCSVFADTVARLGDADALIDKAPDGTRRVLSWNQYRERVRAAALGYHALGIAPGSFGVVLCRNRAEYVIADLGLVHAGGTPVGLYNTLSPEQIAYICRHCDARIAIVEDAAGLDKVLRAAAELPLLERIVLIDGASDDPRVITWDELLATGRAAHERDPYVFDKLWHAVAPDDTATLIYTSGTTGPPKGVIDTHRTSLWVLESIQRMGPTNHDDRIISYLPLAHAADRFLNYYGSLVTGHTVAFCSDLTRLSNVISEVRPTVFAAVPRIWEKLHAGVASAIAKDPDEARRRMVLGAIELSRRIVALEQRGEPVPAELRQQRAAVEPVFAAIRARIGLERVRYAACGAAPTPLEVLEFFHAIGIAISEVWGMSELGVVGTRNPDRIKLGSIGVAIPGCELRLAADGELQIRGGNVMPGYYKDPDKTAETIDADGWLATGDIATVDADGYYTIVDRKKELIITAGGKNISPANLENLLKANPLIGQACVIGDNRAYLTALIVLDGQGAPAWAAARGIASGASIAELAGHPEIQAEVSRAIAQVNERVSRVENIRRWTVLPAEWTAESEELTPTLKLKRRVIVTKHARAIAAMYEGDRE